MRTEITAGFTRAARSAKLSGVCVLSAAAALLMSVGMPVLGARGAATTAAIASPATEERMVPRRKACFFVTKTKDFLSTMIAFLHRLLAPNDGAVTHWNNPGNIAAYCLQH